MAGRRGGGRAPRHGRLDRARALDHAAATLTAAPCAPPRGSGSLPAASPSDRGDHMGADRARIGIIGAGAIGCVVGGLLKRAGHDVTLVDPWPEHVEQIKSAGLRLSGSCGEHVVPITALHLHELATVREPFEAVFVAVKSYDTEWATQLAVDYLRRPDGVVVDFQNGINDHRVAAVAGRERTLGCVILISAGMYEAAHAIRTDRGSAAFKIGEHDGRDSPRARRLAAIMSEVAPAVVTTNLWGERWSKLALNCMLNPLAGLSGLGTAEVRSESVPRRVAAHLGAEVVRVGTALGHRIEPILGIAAQRFAAATDSSAIEVLGKEIAADAASRSGGRPSMLQDVMKGRRTEIDYLNGFVAAEGRAVGIATPFNDAVVDAFHAYPVGALTAAPRTLLALPPRLIEGALGVFFLGMIPARRWLATRGLGLRPRHLLVIGAAVGFLTGIVVTTGPITAPIFLSYGLVKGAFI